MLLFSIRFAQFFFFVSGTSSKKEKNFWILQQLFLRDSLNPARREDERKKGKSKNGIERVESFAW